MSISLLFSLFFPSHPTSRPLIHSTGRRGSSLLRREQGDAGRAAAAPYPWRGRTRRPGGPSPQPPHRGGTVGGVIGAKRVRHRGSEQRRGRRELAAVADEASESINGSDRSVGQRAISRGARICARCGSGGRWVAVPLLPPPHP
jgi:hypothetical protein